MSRFFINRPIFAWVIAIMVMLAGLLAIKTLPVSQYPRHRAADDRHQRHLSGRLGADGAGYGYPGCRTETEWHRQPDLHGIHQRLGRGGYIYLTFKAGTDPNIAQVQVQNKLQTGHAASSPDRAAAGDLRWSSPAGTTCWSWAWFRKTAPWTAMP